MTLIIPNLIPGLHPVFTAADDFERLDNFDAVASMESISGINGGQFNCNSRRLFGHIRFDGFQIFQGFFSTLFDQLSGAERRDLTR